jgi:hypothetical protein
MPAIIPGREIPVAASEIKVFVGRAKAFALQWKQGGTNGPPIDATGAVFAVIATTLPWPPSINVIDASVGKFELVFSEACTKGLTSAGSSTKTVTLALTFGGDPAHSPDPINLQVVIS